MGLFDGKKGLILGVANDHSIAWAIAQQVMAEGGQCGFTHLPDRPDDERQRNRRRVAMLTDPCLRPSSWCRSTCRTTSRYARRWSGLPLSSAKSISCCTRLLLPRWKT